MHILLQGPGLEVKEVYSHFKRTNLGKVKCSNMAQAQHIIMDSHENNQGWMRAYNGENVQP